ncbi:MAG: succinate dehydrogenase, cytochrome b556 subunit [Proteobacteria bacterium]|nr:succinate dehydrogenase, cytochrome b556 subunit [Pseudomonadota bacterium]
MPKGKRPLSPHLQVYRPQLTSTLSIFHRITGVALAAGMVLLVAWLLAAGAGPAPFAVAQGLLGSWLGMVVLLGFSFALFFHLCNGVRHLFWDAGWGFELPQVYASGWSVVVVSILLTGAAWAFGLTMMGGGS